jgi:hypothetical protein
VRSGNVQLVNYLIERGLLLTLEDTHVVIYHAVHSGSVHMLQFLQSRAMGDWSQACLNGGLLTAGKHGHVEVAQWFRAHGY